MSHRIARLTGAVIAFVVLVLGGMAMSSGSALAGTHFNVQSLHYQPCYGYGCYGESSTYGSSGTYGGAGGYGTYNTYGSESSYGYDDSGYDDEDYW